MHLTSVSKKLGQGTVVYYYCDSSQFFFETDVIWKNLNKKRLEETCVITWKRNEFTATYFWRVLAIWNQCAMCGWDWNRACAWYCRQWSSCMVLLQRKKQVNNLKKVRLCSNIFNVFVTCFHEFRICNFFSWNFSYLL